MFYAIYSPECFGVFSSIIKLNSETAGITETYTNQFLNIESASVFAITGYNAFQQALSLGHDYQGQIKPLLIDRLYFSEEFF